MQSSVYAIGFIACVTLTIVVVTITVIPPTGGSSECSGTINNSIEYSSNPIYVYWNAIVSVGCIQPSVSGSVTCTKDNTGFNLKVLQACPAPSCDATQVPNSDKAANSSITGNTTATVIVTCASGYHGGGPWTCGTNGLFTGDNCSVNIECNATQVPNSDKAANSSITGNTTATVTVTCNSGYHGGGTWTCGHNELFTGTACSVNTPCTATQVPNSDKAANSSITGNTTATVTVTCNAGYSGGGTWTCGTSAVFTGTACI